MIEKNKFMDKPESEPKSKTKPKYKINNELYAEEDFLKDCPDGEFVPTVLPPVKRLIAIGDIHGDLNLAIKSFKLAGLIDDDFNWIAKPKNTIVVQVGDQIDSCRPIPGVYDCHGSKYPDDKSDDMNVIKFFNDMHQKASANGGAVYSLLGNHELMNSQGNFAYASYDNYYNFKYESEDGTMYEGPSGKKKAFAPGGPVAKILACNRQSVLVVGSTMFVHAGVLPVLASRLDYLNLDNETKLKYLNAVVRKWLLHNLSQKDVDNKTMFINDPKISPFWTRVYGSIPEHTDLESSECFSSVKKTIEVFKLGQLVVGHTPQLYTNKNGINGTCYEKDGSNKLYRVDGGFSQAFKVFGDNDLIQVLEILNDTEFKILTDKTTREYTKPPDININERQMKKVSYIYSQNRTSSDKPLDISSGKKSKVNRKTLY